jgi:hypothetical protein
MPSLFIVFGVIFSATPLIAQTKLLPDPHSEEKLIERERKG